MHLVRSYTYGLGPLIYVTRFCPSNWNFPIAGAFVGSALEFGLLANSLFLAMLSVCMFYGIFFHTCPPQGHRF